MGNYDRLYIFAFHALATFLSVILIYRYYSKNKSRIDIHYTHENSIGLILMGASFSIWALSDIGYILNSQKVIFNFSQFGTYLSILNNNLFTFSCFFFTFLKPTFKRLNINLHSWLIINIIYNALIFFTFIYCTNSSDLVEHISTILGFTSLLMILIGGFIFRNTWLFILSIFVILLEVVTQSAITLASSNSNFKNLLVSISTPFDFTVSFIHTLMLYVAGMLSIIILKENPKLNDKVIIEESVFELIPFPKKGRNSNYALTKKQTILDFVKKGEMHQALDLLDATVTSNIKYKILRDDVIALNSRFHTLQKEFDKNLILYTDYKIELSKITNCIISLSNKLIDPGFETI